MSTPFDDAFTGNNGDPPDSNKWDLIGSPDIQSNEVEITNAGTAEVITSKYVFNGDFDVQIDFDIQSEPAVDSFGCELLAIIDSTHQMYVSAARWGGSRRFQEGFINGGGWTYKGTARTNSTGKLRIVRGGPTHTVKVYYADGAGTFILFEETYIGSATDPMVIEIKNVQWDSAPTITCRYDNYVINSGYVAPVNDGVSSGGLVFGGEVIEVESEHVDLLSSGGLVFGGAGDLATLGNEYVDGPCIGGLVFGGEAPEQWINPWAVAVKGGTYRISGVLYTLANTMFYPGLGDIAALITVSAPPTSAGLYRYDLLSIDDAGNVTVTEGTEAATPVMPATPTGEVKLDHILRYYGQTSIVQGDVGKLYKTPQLTKLTAVIADNELAWAELSTAITIYAYDQYGALFMGGVLINASFVSGNGTIAPAVKSGSGGSFSFTYTRGHTAGDISPVIQFMASTGMVTVAFIMLLDADGKKMF